MKREIKFRAWDTNDKKIIEWDRLIQVCDNVGGGGKWAFKNERLILQQFTGLTDKDGKEIYEGDIIDTGFFGIGIIVWNEKICAFQYAYHAIGKGTGIGGRMTNTLYAHESGEKYMVVGNVYENPDSIQ